MAKPSELFLALWYHRSMNGTITAADFADCADAWLQIQELETMCTSKQAFEEVFPMSKEKKREPEREIQIDQHTFEIVAEPEKTEEKPETATKISPNAKRKQEIRDRIIEARKKGIGTQSIANASGGKVTDTTIYQIINAEPVDIRTYERIAQGLDKLGA